MLISTFERYQIRFAVWCISFLLSRGYRPEQILYSFLPIAYFSGGDFCIIYLGKEQPKMIHFYWIDGEGRPSKALNNHIRPLPSGYGYFCSPPTKSILVRDEKHGVAAHYIAGNEKVFFGLTNNTNRSLQIYKYHSYIYTALFYRKNIFYAASSMPEFWGMEFDVDHEFPLYEETIQGSDVSAVFDKRTGAEVWRSGRIETNYIYHRYDDSK